MNLVSLGQVEYSLEQVNLSKETQLVQKGTTYQTDV